MKTYKIEIVTFDGTLFDTFIVLAEEFSEALDKAQVYIEVESRKKQNKGINFEIGCVERKDDITEIKRISGIFVEPTFK